MKRLYLFPLFFTASSSFAAAASIDIAMDFFAGIFMALTFVILAGLAIDALSFSYRSIRYLLTGRPISSMSDDE